MRQDRRLLLLICLAEVLSMTGFAAWPALLPHFQASWQLSGKAAGAVGGAYFAGYMLAVPVLSGFTDRIDARRIYFLSCLLAVVGSLGFALFASDALSAGLFQILTGAGLAGTYMPGLKALSDRLSGPRQPRFVAIYTATFGIGASLSYGLSGWVGDVLGWQAAFLLGAIGPLLAGFLMLLGLRQVIPHGAARRPSLVNMFRVLGDRVTLGYVLGYAAHCWELFGLRSWIVALLAFSAGTGVLPLSAASIAALINLVGIPASIFGNELAGRFGRRRFILLVMVSSGVLAWLTGAAAGWPLALLAVLVLYNVAVMADSGALTAGLIAAAEPARLGAALAIYSLFGFGAGFLGPLAFGAVLDAGGGKDSGIAWFLACGSLGLGCLLAPLATLFGKHSDLKSMHPVAAGKAD